jgi:gamma-glutamyl-gamma-aminobutyrate hydrolase PuuD
MKRVFILNGGMAYFQMFKEMGYEIADTLANVDLVCFTGGEDVSPHLYGQHKHPTTYNSERRDEQETNYFAKSLYNKIPMVGICRGAQFLNVMCGGEMYQDVGKHAVHQGHELIDVKTEQRIHVSSTHHQMMKPGRDSVLVAYAELKGFREWYDGGDLKADISDKDIEVVAYPKSKVLCFQPHPEFNAVGYEGMRKYFSELLEELVAT